MDSRLLSLVHALGNAGNGFNTPLTPEQEAAFQKAYPRPEDTADYDMRGAFLSGAGQAGNGHYPDTFKKPNHMTFSTESQYSNPENGVGGVWTQRPDQTWDFQASPTNLQQHSPSDMLNYFFRVERGNNLTLPKGTK